MHNVQRTKFLYCFFAVANCMVGELNNNLSFASIVCRGTWNVVVVNKITE